MAVYGLSSSLHSSQNGHANKEDHDKPVRLFGGVTKNSYIYKYIYMLYMSYIVYTYTENVWKIPRNVSPHGAFMVFPWVLPSDLERLR